MDKKKATKKTPEKKAPAVEPKKLLVCTKAFNAETARLEDEDDPCDSGVN